MSYIVKMNDGNKFVACSKQGVKECLDNNKYTVQDIDEVIEYTKMYFTTSQFKELFEQ